MISHDTALVSTNIHTLNGKEPHISIKLSTHFNDTTKLISIVSYHTYSVESVVDKMLQILAHPDLSHQLVFVSVHSSQLTHMSKYILQSI